jgi:hypothetical protein
MEAAARDWMRATGADAGSGGVEDGRRRRGGGGTGNAREEGRATGEREGGGEIFLF